MGRGGGGQVVSVNAFYYNDPSLNPAEVYRFYSVKLIEKNENINEELFGDGPWY